MRRVLAAHLLAILTIPQLLPSAWVDAKSKLPACCRRNGNHHCAEMDQVETAPSDSAVVAHPATCPLFPKAATAPGQSPTILIGALSILHSAPRSFVSKVPKSNKVYSVFCGSCVRKRGPPSYFC